jgi:hypothetical protein
MSVFGTRLFGKVDTVPGVFHVATKCFHINFVPLIPVQTYVVISQDGRQFRGVPVSLSFKSFGMAWLRLIAGLISIVGAILIPLASTGNPHDKEMLVPGIGMVVVGVVLLGLSYKFKPITHASYDRACSLAKKAGFTDEVIAQIHGVYGVTPKISANAKSSIPPRVPLPSQRKG